MGARRRAGPAAIAAALIGAGLALSRPRHVTELRPGPRVAPPASAAALAAAADRPAAPGLAPAASGYDGDKKALRPSAADDEGAVWRDAPSDRPFMAGERAAKASRAASAAERYHRELRESPSAAETDAVRAAGSSGSQADIRRGAREPGSRGPLWPAAAAAAALLRRSPLAQGPADSDEAQGGDGDVARAAYQQGASHPAAAAWTRRRPRAFPLFRPPRREARPPKRAAAPRRARPLLLSKLLGRGALRPPSASIVPPDLSSLQGRKPLLLPDGSPAPALPYELGQIEEQDPRGAATACRRRAGHWDAGPLWHDGAAARGVIADSRWLWLWKEESRWWAAREPELAPLLRHRERWWSKRRGVWFALHDGELWSWRRFADWDAEGMIRLADGVELVYSADFTKVAVITPGAGAVLYDAHTGAELGEWLEEELPRRRPRAPAGLRLPRGI